MDVLDEGLSNIISDIMDGDTVLVMNSLATKFDKRLLQPIGRIRVYMVHLAAFRGKMELLKLFHRNGADINATDAIGRCALFYAANRGDNEMVNWLLQQGAYTENKVSIDTCFKNNNRLVLGQCPIGNNLPSPECMERTPLHQAVANNHSEVVKLLVNAGANVHAEDERRHTPLLLAGSVKEIRTDPNEMGKFFEIVKTLVSAEASTTVFRPVTGTTPLHTAAELGNAAAAKVLLDAGASPLQPCYNFGNTPLHVAASIGSYDTVLVLLEKTPCFGVDITNNMKQTPLYLTACGGYCKCAKVLINRGGNLAAQTDYGETVMDVIFTHILRPQIFLNDVFDSGVQILNKSKGENLQIIVNFNVLTPEVEKQMAVVMSLIAAAPSVEQLSILQHPLLETFLYLKWSKLRVFFFTLIFVHIMLVFSLSGYTIMLVQYEMDYAPLKIVLTFFSLVLLIHNMAQMLMAPRYYLRQFEMWMSYACATISLVISLGSGYREEIQPRGEVLNAPQHLPHSKWMPSSISVAILLGWIQMMLIIGRLPACGYYALMFSTVLRNILKVLAVFIFLIVGFALSFTVMFHENDQFRNFWTAFVKTMVMMTGEYEYADLFEKKKEENSSLLFTSEVLFLAFIMLVGISLMNLMIGLAVNDIQELEKQGRIAQLLKQAEFVSHLEGLISHQIFRSSWLHPRIKYWLNSRRNIPNTFHFYYHKRNSGDLSANISAPKTEALSLLAFRNLCADKNLIMSGEYKSNDSDAELTTFLKELSQQLTTFYDPNTMGQRFLKPSDRKNQFYRRKTMNV
nr:transient receptor potential channel pyrexia-like isoform X1 [Nomia melanderi]